MTVRDIVHIDAEKCDGCGLCVPSCEEGAIRIINAKATVVSDAYCDGLGACLGHCPQGAISIRQRDAALFDAEAVARHLAAQQTTAPPKAARTGCPGSMPTSLQPPPPAASRPGLEQGASAPDSSPPVQSRLANWPVQLHLVPPHAPYLRGADLLLVADCVPFACANFHEQLLDRRPVVIGCPKLDDCQIYTTKLAAIIQQAQLRSIAVVHMEVPCCTGLMRITEKAQRLAGTTLPVQETVVTTRGELADRAPQNPLSSTLRHTPTARLQLPIL